MHSIAIGAHDADDERIDASTGQSNASAFAALALRSEATRALRRIARSARWRDFVSELAPTVALLTAAQSSSKTTVDADEFVRLQASLCLLASQLVKDETSALRCVSTFDVIHVESRF